jgi:hypothetical protein
MTRNQLDEYSNVLGPRRTEFVVGIARKRDGAIQRAFSVFAAAVALSCALAPALHVGASRLSAQTPPYRHVDATVTEPKGRFVTGLKPEHFEVLEDGVRREIKRVEEIRTAYRIEFESAVPSARVEVVVKPPAGLPPLQVKWK